MNDSKARETGAGSTPIDHERALDRLERLLAVPGPTGEEGPVRDFLLAELERIGVPRDAVREDDAPSRIGFPCQCGNLILLLPGNVSGPRRLLSAHMDTVPLAKGVEPVRRGDRIVPAGRTALGGDDRAGVAVVLAALDEVLRQELPHPPLAILFTVREETGVCGARALLPDDLGGVSLGFNFDGRDPASITVGAIGKVFLEIEVEGIAAHAGLTPERGVSAVAIFAGAVEHLEREGWLGAIDRAWSRGTSNIGVVHAGDATNVVADRLVARAEARSHDSAFLQLIAEAYRDAFARAAAARRNAQGQAGRAEVRVVEAYEAYRLADDAPVVRETSAAMRRTGLEPRLQVADGGTDASWLVRHGIPTVTLGCGTHRPHTVEEYVLIDWFRTACRLALDLCTESAAHPPRELA